MLTNLAVNAIKVNPEGKPVRLWATPTDAGDVCISIIDEGPGLKPDDLKVIFDRFKQLDGPQVSATKGFGLGLSIVKQLAFFNLASIEVQSEPGKGSTFNLTLPGNNLSRILDRYIENIRGIDKPGDIRMLEIHWGAKGDLGILRRLVCSYCYPMDLVLAGPDGKSVRAIGVCGDAQAWSDRIRQAIVRLQSSIGQPTEMEITPAGQWKREIDKVQLRSALIERSKEKNAMCEKILLIDDDPRLVGALQIRLEAAGFSVHAAFNGDDGLAAARKLQPHLLILDVNMPGMDGLHVCRVLRAENQFRRTPILIMSAITHEGAKREALESGATQFISKPYDANRVMAAIRSAIEASKTQEAQTAA